MLFIQYLVCDLIICIHGSLYVYTVSCISTHLWSLTKYATHISNTSRNEGLFSGDSELQKNRENMVSIMYSTS